MGTSYIDYKNNGCWIKDGFLEGLYFLLVREFRKIQVKEEWQKELIDKWMSAATIGYSGCIPSYLDEYFKTQNRIDLLRTALENIINSLNTDETYLTIQELNENNIGLGGWQSVNTRGFIETAQLMLDLMDGKLRTNASSPVDY